MGLNMLGVVSRLSDSGIFVFVAGGKLKTQAPEGAITADIADLIRANRDDLIAYLIRDAAAQESKSSKIARRTGQDDAPVSYAQRRLWLLDQIEAGSSHYNIPLALRLSGRLDRAAVDLALRSIIERHESLRTRFVAGADGEPMQAIQPVAPFVSPMTDLSTLGDSERLARITESVAAEASEVFDLARDLMLRSRLLKLADDEHILLVTMHHIAADGWSMAILIGEFSALYGAYSQGQANPLAPLAIQYADYADWQRHWLTGEMLEKQIDYWGKQLAHVPATHSLPLDRTRPAVQGFSGAVHRSRCGQASSAALAALSQKHGATLFMGVHAAFSVLLSRYSNETDIVVGSAIANREQAEVAGLIGFFVNTLVLRSDLSGAPSFDALIEQSKHMLLDAYAHQQVPFEQIVERLQPVRSVSHSPLFQIMLVMQNNEDGTLSLPDLTLSPVEQNGVTAKFDLTLGVSDDPQGLVLEWEYNTDLFEAATIARMAAHFAQLIGEMTAAPERSVFEAPMLNPAEREQLLAGWNATARDFPRDQCIHAFIEEQARLHPEAVAVVFEAAQLTYGELNGRANQLAHYLVQERRVGPDVLVGLCALRSLEMVIGMLGILKAGGAYVPLDPDYPAARLAYMLEDASLATVLTQRALLERVVLGADQAVCLDDDTLLAQLSAQPDINPAPGRADQLAYMIYTSGSTGHPKGVMLEHRALVNRIDWMNREYGSTPLDRILQKTPFSFDVSVWEFMWPLSVGACVVLAKPEGHKDPLYLSSLIDAQQITKLHFVPSMLATMLLLGDFSQCGSLRQVFCSGEALALHHVARFKERCGWAQLHNLYGPTEAAIDVTYWDCADQHPGLGSVPIGRPIHNTQVYVLNAALQPVPQGVAGELHLGGVGLARGYHRRPELTAEKFIANPFGAVGERLYRTGDLVRWLADGNLEYLGRIDHQIKLRGFRIELGEIEAALTAHASVTDAVVVARAGADGDQQLAAYVVGAHAEVSELRAHLLTTLPDYMVPTYFIMLDALPLTSNGKVDRKTLPEPDMAQLHAQYVAPRTDGERILTEIWQEILGLEQVGVTDNFFKLGGHSLLAMRLIARIRERLGVELAVRALFVSHTLADLAVAVANASSESANAFSVPPNLIPANCEHITPDMLTLVQLTEGELASVVDAVPGGARNIQDIYPLAPLQEGILFHHMMAEQGDAYLLPTLLAFDSREALTDFTDAMQQVIDRHDILRTAMAWGGLPEPLQVVWRRAPLAIEEVQFSVADGPVAQQLGARFDPRHYRLDVRAAPLLRGFAAEDAGNKRWLLQILAHHLVIDHTTLELIMEEIQTILQGRAGDLPLALPFRNFVAQARLGIPQAEHEAFFADMLGHVDEPTAPFGLLDVQGDGSGIEEMRRELDPDLAQRVRRQARKLGVTPASLMHLAWAQVLARVAGRAEVVFGTVLFGRMQAGQGADRILGMFINTLPLCIAVDGRDVRQSVQQTHALLTQLLRHEHASLALAQRCSGVKAPTPLFSSILNYRHNASPAGAEPDGPDGAGTRAASSEERTNYPVTVSIDDLGDGFTITAQVAGSIGAARVCGYMQTVLENLVRALETAPATPVNQVEVLPLKERHQLLVAWNATSAPYPAHRTIHQLFEAQAMRTPDRIALIFEEQQLTYAQLDAKANQLAQYLRAHGVGPNTLVALCVDRSVEMLIGVYGILKAGGAYVPLDPTYPKNRLAYMLDDASPALLLTQQHLLAQLPASGLPTFVLDAHWADLDSYARVRPEPSSQPNDLAYVIYTSGSTGNPKGVAVEHAGVCNRLQWTHDTFALTTDDRVLQKTPYSFDVSVWELLGTMAFGACLVVARPEGHQDPEYLAQVIAAQRITRIHFVPPMLEVFLNVVKPAQCGSLRQVLCSGQALGFELQQRFFAKFADVALINLYGPTEASVDVTFWQCRADSELNFVPIGKPMCNIQIHILDSALNPVPLGVAGELHIAGIGLARGYLKRPELTAEKFIANPFSEETGARMYKSGDLARYLPDGSIEYLGRIDHQVKIRGLRIELGEIEAALAAVAAVRDVVVLAREDNPGDQRLVAYLVAHDDLRLPPAAEMKLRLLQGLPDYMVPAHFIELDALPLTSNGKIDRKALPAPERGLDEGNYVAPRSASETLLADIWAGVLKLERVGVHDNFFELGGHSLLAITLLERMRSAGFAANIRALFATPTIAALALEGGVSGDEVEVPPNLIDPDSDVIAPDMLTLVRLTEGEIASVVKTVPGGARNIQDIYPLAPLQEGILFHHMMAEQGDAYLLPTLIAFDSHERLTDFTDAMQQVIDRHDILRTAMAWGGLPEPLQVVWRRAPLAIEEVQFSVADGPIADQLGARFDPRHYRLDVRAAPMLRGFAAEDAGNKRWLLQILAHHLVIDHTTLELIIEEIQTILQGRAGDLPLALPFRNFVAQARLGIPQAEHEAFFTDMLAHVDEPTAPFGLLDVQGDGSGIEEVRRELDPDLAQRVRRQARKLGVSSASLMHLAWAQVLARVAGRAEVVFGTVLFGRMQAGQGADRILGMFINTLPLCIAVDGRDVRQSVQQTHALLTQLLRHEHASLALAQRCSGVKAPTPLFSSILNYRHSALPADADDGATGLTGMQGLGSEERTNYPVTLSIDDLGDGFAITAQVDDSVGAERVCSYMQTALANLVLALENAPSTCANQIDIVPLSEQHQLLVKWNDTAAAYPPVRTIHQLFELQAARTPERIALVFDERQLTYAELNARANRLALYLQAQGVGPDTLVAICVDRSVEMLVGLYGILKAGGAYVPLDPTYPENRLAYMLDDASPALLLTQQHLLARLPRTSIGTFVLDAQWAELDGYASANPQHSSLPEHLAYVMYTSGSTGNQKGVAVEHGGVCNRMEWMQNTYPFAPGERLLQKTPYSFDVSVWELFGPLAYGACLVVAKPGGHQDPDYLSAAIGANAITRIHFVPPMLEAFMNVVQPRHCTTLRQVLCTGQAVPIELQQRFFAKLPAVGLFNLYGPTEASIEVTYWQCDPDTELNFVPIGKPMSNIQMHILDSNLNLVPAGVAGELYIAGICLARGYFKRPGLTAANFIANPFSKAPGARMYKSGDLARYMNDGNIEYLGRIDYQVKIRGFRIELGEIETALAAMPEVRDVVVMARDDRPGDPRLVAYLVAHDAMTLPPAAQMKTSLLKGLPDYMVPAHFIELDDFPLTSNGKLDRKALPAPDSGAAEADYVAPRTSTERLLADVWTGVFKLERVGIHDDFFALGGHSLLAMTLITAVRHEFGEAITLQSIFDAPTIARLAQAIDEKMTPAAVPAHEHHGDHEADETPDSGRLIWD